MCRYAFHDYKEPFACFDCRKVFKQTTRWGLPESERPLPGERRLIVCPQCGQPMADMGKDFHAPRSRNVKQWEKVRALYSAGFSFDSCGCCGPGARPKTLREVTDFVKSRRPLSDGEELLRKIATRKRP